MLNRSLLLIALIFCGCGTTQIRYDSVKRQPTKRIDLYREAQKPNQSFRVIGLLADDARMEEKPYLEGKFARKARNMGANGLIFAPFEQTSKAPEGWEIYDTYAYKAYVIIYDGPRQGNSFRRWRELTPLRQKEYRQRLEASVAVRRRPRASESERGSRRRIKGKSRIQSRKRGGGYPSQGAGPVNPSGAAFLRAILHILPVNLPVRNRQATRKPSGHGEKLATNQIPHPRKAFMGLAVARGIDSAHQHSRSAIGSARHRDGSFSREPR